MAAITAEQLAEVFDAHAAALTLYARQFVSSSAEDLVQEAFINLAGQAAMPGNVKGWLVRAVRNLALDAVKMARRRAARDLRAGEERVAMFAQHTVATGVSGEELQRALEGLPRVQREIVVLRIWGEGTFEEIAAVVSMPLSTVYQQYRSGLEALRSRWELPCRKK
ncbi:MAG: RNA polymerase sigma factor [Phycisphaerae bacterium]